MSGLGAPALTATPMPERAMSTREPATSLPSLIKPSMPAPVLIKRSAASPSATRSSSAPVWAASASTGAAFPPGRCQPHERARKQDPGDAGDLFSDVYRDAVARHLDLQRRPQQQVRRSGPEQHHAGRIYEDLQGDH